MPTQDWTPRTHRCRVPRSAELFAALPDHHYRDAFTLTLRPGDARDLPQLLAARGTGRPERVLARLRDTLVAPFGLKPIGRVGMAPFERLALTAQEAVYAIDDRHVDVRIGYQTREHDGRRELTASTLVRIHNPFGLAYLCAILPFHSLVVRRQLRRVARAG